MANKHAEVVKFKFTKTQRLLTPEDYKQVFDAVSFKVHSDHLMFLVKMMPASMVNMGVVQSNSNQPDSINSANHPNGLSYPNRLGLAISKGKMKHAHDRNRIKRLVREHFRLKQAAISQHSGKHFDMVVLAKKSLAQLTNKQVNTELDSAFDSLCHKLIKPPKHRAGGSKARGNNRSQNPSNGGGRKPHASKQSTKG